MVVSLVVAVLPLLHATGAGGVAAVASLARGGGGGAAVGSLLRSLVENVVVVQERSAQRSPGGLKQTMNK